MSTAADLLDVRLIQPQVWTIAASLPNFAADLPMCIPPDEAGFWIGFPRACTACEDGKQHLISSITHQIGRDPAFASKQDRFFSLAYLMPRPPERSPHSQVVSQFRARRCIGLFLVPRLFAGSGCFAVAARRQVSTSISPTSIEDSIARLHRRKRCAACEPAEP
jgi:hypothetical protein